MKIFVIAEIGINHNGDLDLCKRLIDNAVDCGADAVKFEGFYPDIVRLLTAHNIQVVCHLGLLPQTALKKSVQAVDKASIQQLYRHACDLEYAGASMLIVELIPEEVAKRMSEFFSNSKKK